ncbi:hypothetical protein BKA63DRAFT_492835 [Paraphoma chrysanthemicola]|nr:hypothetical protein BKA63DRAFT_492835 [Paraphoma chrysanthemicola]
MDQPQKNEITQEITSHTSASHRPPTHNPYQRISSRRAIACVTCAKAKTKCDKALPSCSRCITKGIKCDPRSTRRTSENNYRTNIKKPFVSPKRYHSTSHISSLSRHSSPRSTPSSSRHRFMRAASHIDFRTAVKMSQQASACSGLPVLTPLPTYRPQIMDESYSYSSSPEQNMMGVSAATDHAGLAVSGRLTPQTPEPIVYHEPLSLGDFSDHWTGAQPWNNESVMSCGLDIDGDYAGPIPVELWSTPEYNHPELLNQVPWHQPSLSVSPHIVSAEMVPNAGAVPALCMSEGSLDDFNMSGTFHEDWALCRPTTDQLGMASILSAAPFMHDLRPVSSVGPVWEDVFMPDHPPY